MTPLIEGDRLTITLTFGQCAALWARDERVFLSDWTPGAVEVYVGRWATMPGDLLLAGHLDFRDAAGRTWFEVVHWSRPPSGRLPWNATCSSGGPASTIRAVAGSMPTTPRS